MGGRGGGGFSSKRPLMGKEKGSMLTDFFVMSAANLLLCLTEKNPCPWALWDGV